MGDRLIDDRVTPIRRASAARSEHERTLEENPVWATAIADSELDDLAARLFHYRDRAGERCSDHFEIGFADHRVTRHDHNAKP
jgi:hypothetical protein